MALPGEWIRTYPAPSFYGPLPAPEVDPTAEPTISVSISCEWLPYVRGALMQLTQPSIWDVPDNPGRQLVIDRAATLISLFVECASAEIPFSCPYTFEVPVVTAWQVLPADGDFTPPPMGTFFPLFGFQPDPKFSPSLNLTQTFVGIMRTWLGEFLLDQVDVRFNYHFGNDFGGHSATHENLSVAAVHLGAFVTDRGTLGSAMVDGDNQHIVYHFGGVLADELVIVLTVGFDGPGNVPGSGVGALTGVTVFGRAPVPPDCNA